MEFRFTNWDDQKHGAGMLPFDRLFDVFQQLLEHTAGDAGEALNWMTQLDNKYGLTDGSMGIGDFIDELKKRGYLKEDQDGAIKITARTERTIRSRALEEVFRQLRKAGRGDHKTPFAGKGDERLPETRNWQFGDDVSLLDITGTLSNSFKRCGAGDWNLAEDDFQVYETDFRTNMATVLMIDLSHSMVLYGEDRITPARKTAMALSELILTRYPKDTLDILVFGNDAWQIEVKDLPYLEVGPYHTNTVAGLELAIDIIRRRRNPNKQIFMITDGKPTCIKKGKKYYKNSFGLDRKIVNRTLNLAARCKKMDVPITTFMIARDPYLVNFVEQFTKANNGKAFYSSLKGLGEFIFMDYKDNKRRRG